MAAFWRYAEALVARRAERPQDDFTTDLLQGRDGALPALTHHEVTQFVYSLLFAGHETTTGLISNALRQLLTHRHAWEEICRDASLIPNAVEEVLRFDSSVIAWRRKTTEAVEIGGVPVPAGQRLLPSGGRCSWRPFPTRIPAPQAGGHRGREEQRVPSAGSDRPPGRGREERDGAR